MCGEEADLWGLRPWGIADQQALDPAVLRKQSFELAAGVVLADQADEDAASAERGDVARDIAGAADIGLAALDRDDRRWRFRGNPRHLAVDEFVQHEVADAEHGLAADSVREGFEIEHLYSLPAVTVSGSDRRDRGNSSRKCRPHLPAP